jgi:hypothetical protein
MAERNMPIPSRTHPTKFRVLQTTKVPVAAKTRPMAVNIGSCSVEPLMEERADSGP